MNKIVSSAMFFLICGQTLFAQSLLHEKAVCNNKIILGSVEKINLLDKNVILDAKLDSGADMSSLSATHIVYSLRNQEEWITFTVDLGKSHQQLIIAKPLWGKTHILNRKAEQVERNKHDSRPVIKMTICMGKQKQSILVNLVDRRDFRYPVLIGRDALRKFNVLINVREKYLTKPSCK